MGLLARGGTMRTRGILRKAWLIPPQRPFPSTMNRLKTLLGAAAVGASVLSAGCAARGLPLEAEAAIVAEKQPRGELRRIDLGSEEGQALLAGAVAVDYDLMAGHWIAQLPSHCGAASAVIVQNSMIEGAAFTQDNLFIDETAHIITQDVVYRIGFTLDELTEMIATRSGLATDRFHAGTGRDTHDARAFRRAVRRAVADPDTRLVANFSRQYWLGTGTLGGHFSPVAAYNEAEDMVLVLEVNQAWPMVWLDLEDFWDSMATVDRISGLPRGWIVVERP